ncbi:MAG: phosphate transport system regulatory protein PhoU [Gammaproteobacteria bacterium]|nr:phosphate transport system regulatory protein PhoU [Gammaproteobacteria bacterium]
MRKYQGRKSLDLALLEIDTKITVLSSQVQAIFKDSMKSFYDKDLKRSQKIIEEDFLINNFSKEVETQSIEIIRDQAPLASDMRKLTSLIFVSQELERIADYSSGICKINLKIGDEPFITQFEKIPKMEKIAIKMLKDSIIAFCNASDMKSASKAARDLIVQDDEIDHLNSQVQKDLIKRMSRNPKLVKQGTYIIWIAHNLERIADRATNIAERTLYVISGDSAVLTPYDDSFYD